MTTVMPTKNKIRIAIIGAGRMGAMLADELQNNTQRGVHPGCASSMWIRKKSAAKSAASTSSLPGRVITDGWTAWQCRKVGLCREEIPGGPAALYDRYKSMGFKVKVYTFPVENTEESGRRQIREVRCGRAAVPPGSDFLGEEARSYYRDKVVLVSGGGGSIGSELSRQIARMHP